MTRKFLLIDDSMVARMLLKTVLKDTNATMVEKSDGESGLAELESVHDYDLVFLDITMPGIGGMETLRRIKILAPHIPVVMVTADIQKKTIAEAMDSGAFDVIPKQIEKAVIDDLLERVFGAGKTA